MSKENSARNISDKSPKSNNLYLQKILSFDLKTQKTLIDQDNDIVFKCEDKTLNSLLFLAVRSNQYSLVEYLLEKNADINHQNHLGESPLHKAVENGNHQMINLLLDQGSDPNLQLESGQTPMHLAAEKGDYKVLKLLLLYHADPFIPTKAGELPEDYANERGNRKCVNVLAKAISEIELSDIMSSPNKPIRDAELNHSNGTSEPMSGLPRKKNSVIALKSGEGDYKSDNGNKRYNGIVDFGNYYNQQQQQMQNHEAPRTPISKHKERDNFSNRIQMNNNKNYGINHYEDYDINHNDNDDDDNEEEEEDEDEDDGYEEGYENNKMPFIKAYNEDGNEENYDFYDRDNENNKEYFNDFNPNLLKLSPLISASELFIDKAKELMIFHSEANDIIVDEFIRQSTVRFSLKKNNTLKSSKVVQNTYSDEYESPKEKKNNSRFNLYPIKERETNDHSNHLPESIPEESELNNYLRSIAMERYTDVLIKQGFDDLSMLLEQMKTRKGITDLNLKDVGISIPGHRAKILLKLQLDSGSFDDRINPGNAFYFVDDNDILRDHTTDEHLKRLYLWLVELKLSDFFINFFNCGYHSLDLLVLQSLSKTPLTEEILENDLHIPKLGYRLRILNKLSEDAHQLMLPTKALIVSPTDFQSEGKNQLCRCLIF